MIVGVVAAVAMALVEGQSLRLEFEPGLMNGISFDVYCADPSWFGDIQFDAQSGKGTYPLVFTDSIVRGWTHVDMTIDETFGCEGEISGWGAVTDFVFRAPGRSVGVPMPEVRVENFAPLYAPSNAEALVVVSEKPGGGACESRKVASQWVRFLRENAVPCRIVSALDLKQRHFVGVRAVFAPCPDSWPDASVRLLDDYISKGGAVLATDAAAPDIARALGLKGVRKVSSRSCSGYQFGELVRVGAGLPGQPEALRVQDWTSLFTADVPECGEKAELLAVWADATGRDLGLPALVRTGRCYFLSHSPRFGLSKEQSRFVRSLVRSMLPRPPERRAFWSRCWGMDADYTWEKSAKFLADNGFTDVFALFGWAGMSFYCSKVRPEAPSVAAHGDMLAECLAACRRHGVRCHAFNVCWVVGADAPREYRDRLEREGRFQRSFSGELQKGWVCPSHPENRRELVEVMLEYARAGVDGIQFDFIRHNGVNYCFCDACRHAFEQEAGPVRNWPADVRRDAGLAAKWNRFRCETHTSVIREVRARLAAENLRLEVSAAVQPDPSTVASGFAQDWPAWCREGLVDTVCTMIYKNSPGRFRRMVEAELAAVAGTGVALLPGISTGGFKCATPEEESRLLAEEVRESREAGCAGVALFVLDDCRTAGLIPSVFK